MTRSDGSDDQDGAPPPTSDDGRKGTAKGKGKGSTGLDPTIGGILVGFDQEIMRHLPPTQELVKRGAPVRRVTGQDGSDLVIGLPEDIAEDAGDAGDPEEGQPTGR